MIAPVEGSGDWPAWITRVERCKGSDFIGSPLNLLPAMSGQLCCRIAAIQPGWPLAFTRTDFAPTREKVLPQIALPVLDGTQRFCDRCLVRSACGNIGVDVCRITDVGFKATERHQAMQFIARVFAIVPAVRPVSGIGIVHIPALKQCDHVFKARGIRCRQYEHAARFQHARNFTNRVDRVVRHVFQNFSKYDQIHLLVSEWKCPRFDVEAVVGKRAALLGSIESTEMDFLVSNARITAKVIRKGELVIGAELAQKQRGEIWVASNLEQLAASVRYQLQRPQKTLAIGRRVTPKLASGTAIYRDGT